MAKDNAKEPTKDQEDHISKQLNALINMVSDVSEKLSIAETTIAAQEVELAKLKESTSDAVNNPVVKSGRMDSREVDVVEELARILKSVGPARESLDEREIEVLDKPVSKEKMDELAFMEEMVTIKVHDTNDPTAIPVPPVWVNGKAQYFVRGMEQTVRRKYVERLARAKITTFSQREEFDEQGNRVFVQVPHSAQLFPFELVEDANPRGRDWLRSVLRDPQ